MIRELGPQDAAHFRALRQAAMQLDESGMIAVWDDWHAQPLSDIAEMLRQEQESLNDFILGAFEEGELIGMIGFFRPTKPTLGSKGHVWGTFLLPSWRGKGVAGQLLDELIRRARRLPNLMQIQITCGSHHKNSIALYQSRGFRIFATESNALRVGDRYYDELYMMLSLR